MTGDAAGVVSPTTRELTALVHALMAKVRLLEDDREIRALLSAYAFTADVGREQEWVELFTDDACVDLGPAQPASPAGGAQAYVGKDGLLGLLRGPAHLAQVGHCQHHTVAGPLMIHIDGDEAVAEGYSVVLVESDENERRTRSARSVKPELNVSVANVNHWALRRVDGRWRIARRSHRPLGDPGIAEMLSTSLAALR